MLGLGRLKRFIRRMVDNDSHPKIHGWFMDRDARKLLARHEAHSRMTYAEIEAEISRQYQAMFGRPLNWENPRTYNEKIHVSKLYMPTPQKTRLADKVAVREWITEKIGSEYLIPLLGVYDSFDEIDFDALPDQFVIKCNHDSGSYTLVKDKAGLNMELLRKKYDLCMKRNYAWMGWEMHYRDIKPKIMVEKYMDGAENNYEFLCFDGKPYVCWVDFDHLVDRRRNVYDMNWSLLPFNISRCTNYPSEVPCPEQFETMKEFAAKLSAGFSMVRVDFYLIGGKIYFEEMTFSSGNGFSLMTPDEWDYKLGALWPFDTSVRAQVLARSSRP